MAEYLSAGSSSRVILKDSTTWDSWLANIESIALSYEVWDLCNPELEAAPKPLEEPKEPDIEKTKEEYKEDWFQVYQATHLQWTSKNSRYVKKRQGLNIVVTAIRNSVHANYQPFIIDYKTPYELLRNLRQRFASECDPTNAARLRQLWRTLDRGLERNTDIDKWLLNWETVQARCKRAKMPEANDASTQFLDAISVMSPGFHETWTLRLQDKNDITFTELLNRYRAHWKITYGKPVASQRGISKAAFSTWQGHEEAKPEQVSFSTKPCPCGVNGGKHAPWRCWEIYDEYKPATYERNQAKKQKWDKAIKADPAWKAWVDKKRQDQGKAPQQAHTTFNEPTFGFFSTEAKKPEAKKPEASKQIDISTTVMSTRIDDIEPVRNRWVVDTGAQMHVCNDRGLFVTFEDVRSSVKVGDTETTVDGVGTVVIYGVSAVNGKAVRAELYNTRYSPNFHSNLISNGLMMKGELLMNFRKNCIETTDGKPVYRVYQDQKLTWLMQPKGLQYPKLTPNDLVFATKIKKSAKEPQSEASIQTWHRRLGHIGQQRIAKLAEMTKGITIESNPGKEKQVCEACQLADAPKQISRRKIGQAYGIFGRVHFDLVQNQPAYNGHNWLTHFYLDGIKCHFAFTHTKKNDCQIVVRKFLALVKNWLKIEIRVFHYDNERSAGHEVETMIEAEGCTIEHSPPGLPEMNGPAERSGGMVVRTARALINDTELPHALWPKAMYAAAYILNRTPTQISNASGTQWIIPWKELMKQAAPDGIQHQTINLSNIRLYGCLTYSRIMKRVQSDKMAPRAEIGYLVGYISKNLYKVWFPHKGRTGIGRVEVVRDAVFDETRRYSKTKPMPSEEDAISTMTDGLGTENWPTVLTTEEAQVEISTQIEMPKSIARIALHDETEHTQQDAVDEAVDEAADEAVDEEVDEEVRERTPLQSVIKEAVGLPTPQSIIRPREQTMGEQTRPQRGLPGSFPSSSPSSPLRSSLPSPRTASLSPNLSNPSFPSNPATRQALSSSPDPISVIPSIEAGGVDDEV